MPRGELRPELEPSADFAGIVVDHDADVVRIGFTEDAGERLAQLKRGFPYPDQLATFTAQRSVAELLEIRDAVLEARGELARHGVDLTSAGIDERRNQVVVRVAEGLEAARDELDAYGDAIRIKRGNAQSRECVSRVSCGPPYRAGLSMFSTTRDGTANGGCTSAFVVRYPFLGLVDDPTDILNDATGQQSYGLLTAGHCELDDQGRESVFRHPANTIVGEITENFYEDFSGLDAGIIRISKEFATNWVYTRAANNPYQITSSQELNTDAVDDVVCMSVPYFSANEGGELREGAKCGRISAIHEQIVDDGGVQLEDQRVAVFTGGVKDGDSGGPVFKNVGIASGVIGGSLLDFFGDPTDEVYYGEIGYLNAYSGWEVVTAPVN